MLGYLSDIFAADEPPSEELSLAIALGEHGEANPNPNPNPNTARRGQ